MSHLFFLLLYVRCTYANCPYGFNEGNVLQPVDSRNDESRLPTIVILFHCSVVDLRDSFTMESAAGIHNEGAVTLAPPEPIDREHADDSQRESAAFSKPSSEESFLSTSTSSDSLGLNQLTSDHTDEAENDEGIIIRTPQDVEGIGLLRQIFPTLSTSELRELYRDRLYQSNSSKDEEANRDFSNDHLESTNDSNAERRRSKLLRSEEAGPIPSLISNDFLRLPPQFAVRRFSHTAGHWHYERIQDLENAVWQQCYDADFGAFSYTDPTVRKTCVVFRNDEGVGITLRVVDESASGVPARRYIRVHALPSTSRVSAAAQANVAIGDILMGVNGLSIHFMRDYPDRELLQHAVDMIQQSPDPVVLHFQTTTSSTASTVISALSFSPLRPKPLGSLSVSSPARPPPAEVHLLSTPMNGRTRNVVTTPSLLDVSNDSSLLEDLSSAVPSRLSSTPQPASRDPVIHMFVAGLATRGVLDHGLDRVDEQLATTRQLVQITQRARQWEDTMKISFDVDSGQLVNHLVTSSRPPVNSIPVAEVRPALSVRILHSFLDGDQVAYTVWVYDVDSGSEWYAPVRYYSDFCELRDCALALCPVLANLPFPRTTGLAGTVHPTRRHHLNLFGRAPVRNAVLHGERDAHCVVLESFLRGLCGALYIEQLDMSLAEVHIHLQSFLGCEDGLRNGVSEAASFKATSACYSVDEEESHSNSLSRWSASLRRSLQRYTWRLFLLDSVKAAVDRFVTLVQHESPSLRDIENFESKGRDVLKELAMKDLDRIRSFLDFWQELIVETCCSDFRSIADRPEYRRAGNENDEAAQRNAAIALDRTIRRAVREQVEIEIYVPLRTVVSRWLVHGWKHEDMELAFKVRELRKRPSQDVFRLPPSGSMVVSGDSAPFPTWRSVSEKLMGVALSTLPCTKLLAIVSAAKEIAAVFAAGAERGKESDGQQAHKTGSPVGPTADDFLPLFINTVVHCDIDRPVALCVLLQTLCDRSNRIGEVGYYLASFEAAIAHISDTDLSVEDEEETSMLSSFLSISLAP
jgi:Vacuolar sorting protein 9 (VPS9) domain